MTLLEIIYPKSIPPIIGARQIRGYCSVRDNDPGDRIDEMIEARKAQIAVKRKSRKLEMIDGKSPRAYRREQRRNAILNFLSGLTPETGLTELEISSKLDLPHTTVSSDMSDLRLQGLVRVTGVAGIRRVYWK